MLEAADQAVQIAARAANGSSGSVAVGFLGAAGVSTVPDALMRLRASSPAVSVRIREFTTGPSVIEALTHRLVDLALLRPPVDAPGVETEELTVEPFVAVLPRGHRLERRKQIDLTDLLAEPFVLWDRASTPRVFDPIFAAAGGIGEPANVVVEAIGIPTIVGMVASGLGVSLLPASAVGRRTTDITVRPLRAPAPTLAQVVAWRRDDLSPVARRLLIELRAAAASPADADNGTSGAAASRASSRSSAGRATSTPSGVSRA